MLCILTKILLNTLHRYGYIFCLVGGCVRDCLVGRTPNGWDIATDALDEQIFLLLDQETTKMLESSESYVSELSSHLVGTGHERIIVGANDDSFDVSSYKGSEPTSLEQDLSLRDFTINSMGMTLDGEIIDLFDGKFDLEK